MGVRRPAAHSTVAAGAKPFSNYRPSSGVSPYLNLFRNDNQGGTIDNYSTLVRPFVQQSYANRRFNTEIRGLERGGRTQSSAIRRLGEATNSLQGVGTPQYYQNTKGFYRGSPK